MNHFRLNNKNVTFRWIWARIEADLSLKINCLHENWTKYKIFPYTFRVMSTQTITSPPVIINRPNIYLAGNSYMLQDMSLSFFCELSTFMESFTQQLIHIINPNDHPDHWWRNSPMCSKFSSVKDDCLFKLLLRKKTKKSPFPAYTYLPWLKFVSSFFILY